MGVRWSVRIGEKMLVRHHLWHSFAFLVLVPGLLDLVFELAVWVFWGDAGLAPLWAWGFAAVCYLLGVAGLFGGFVVSILLGNRQASGRNGFLATSYVVVGAMVLGGGMAGVDCLLSRIVFQVNNKSSEAIAGLDIYDELGVIHYGDIPTRGSMSFDFYFRREGSVSMGYRMGKKLTICLVDGYVSMGGMKKAVFIADGGVVVLGEKNGAGDKLDCRTTAIN